MLRFFDPDPEIDFQGLKSLARQLLDVDAIQINLSELADLILSANTLGSTVKTDGRESDAWAFLSVLNLQEHKDKPVVQSLAKYILDQAKKNSSLETVTQVLQSSDAQVGFLLAERTLNVPTELVPPMYKMLAEEINWAVAEHEPYKFTHYLIISKTYLEIDSALDHEDAQARKKQRRQGGQQTFYFHPEDEIIHKHAIAFGNYSYDREEAEGQSDSRRAFQDAGIKPQGHMMLIEASKYEALVADLEAFVRA